MRIALCDDQIEYAETLLVKLKSFEAFSCAKLDLFSSGNQLLQSVENGNIYDLFFLDIDMPGIDGLELGQRLNSYCRKATSFSSRTTKSMLSTPLTVTLADICSRTVMKAGFPVLLKKQ